MSGKQKTNYDIQQNSHRSPFSRESKLFMRKKEERKHSSSNSQERSSSKKKSSQFKKIITLKDELKKHYRHFQKEAEDLDLTLNYNKNDNTIEICGKHKNVEIFNYFIRTFGRVLAQLQKENIENRPPQPKNEFEPKLQEAPKKENQKKTFDLNNITEFTDDISVKLLELGLEPRLLNNGHISIEGEESKIDKVDEYIKGIVLAKKFYEEKSFKQKSTEDYSEKLLELHQLVLPKKQEIDGKIEELGLFQEKVNRHFSFVGPHKKLLDFVTWLYETTLASVKQKLSKHNFDELEDLVMITHFPYPETLALNGEEVRDKAEELDMIIKFEENKLQVEGNLAGILEFKRYLADNEKMMKKSLYPKYWDFEQGEVLIGVDEDTEEFEKIAGKFYKTMKKHVITRLVRIQSKELMDTYLTALRAFGGNRRRNLKKKLLFQGTDKRKPLEFYNIRNHEEIDYQEKNPFVFEEDYLHPKRGRQNPWSNQMNKGEMVRNLEIQAFKFNHRASDAHKNSYHVHNNLFQMLWVEIYIDEYPSRGDGSYEPYNQNCVYPCYLIEYTGLHEDNLERDSEKYMLVNKRIALI